MCCGGMVKGSFRLKSMVTEEFPFAASPCALSVMEDGGGEALSTPPAGAEMLIFSADRGLRVPLRGEISLRLTTPSSLPLLDEWHEFDGGF